MNKITFAACMYLVPALASASSGGARLDTAHIDLSNEASLQRGARLFVNYCLSCHSASYMRYSRLAEDLGLTDRQVEQNLMFTTEKVGETMRAVMTEGDAADWFGTKIPDLSVIARVRGPDWLYTYLRSFYLDDSRPFGVNNAVFKDVAMPHVLGELQGWQQPVHANDSEAEGGHGAAETLELVIPGSMDPSEYDRAVRDLVAYLTYMAEPVQLERRQLGIRVILFLLVFLVLAYFMKREYWKDVH